MKFPGVPIKLLPSSVPIYNYYSVVYEYYIALFLGSNFTSKIVVLFGLFILLG